MTLPGQVQNFGGVGACLDVFVGGVNLVAWEQHFASQSKHNSKKTGVSVDNAKSVFNCLQKKIAVGQLLKPLVGPPQYSPCFECLRLVDLSLLKLAQSSKGLG